MGDSSGVLLREERRGPQHSAGANSLKTKGSSQQRVDNSCVSSQTYFWYLNPFLLTPSFFSSLFHFLSVTYPGSLSYFCLSPHHIAYNILSSSLRATRPTHAIQLRARLWWEILESSG